MLSSRSIKKKCLFYNWSVRTIIRGLFLVDAMEAASRCLPQLMLTPTPEASFYNGSTDQC